MIALKKRATQKLDDIELEKIASEAMDAVIQRLEKENLEASSGVLIIERDERGVIKARVEIELFTDTPMIPSVDEKAAEVLDEARRVIERGIYGERRKKEDTV